VFFADLSKAIIIKLSAISVDNSRDKTYSVLYARTYIYLGSSEYTDLHQFSIMGT